MTRLELIHSVRSWFEVFIDEQFLIPISILFLSRRRAWTVIRSDESLFPDKSGKIPRRKIADSAVPGSDWWQVSV